MHVKHLKRQEGKDSSKASGSLALGRDCRSVKITNDNSAFNHPVISLPVACAGGCKLRCPAGSSHK